MKGQRTMSGKEKEPATPASYEDPAAPGSLGGVQRFAKAHGIRSAEARKILEQVRSYTLHKPRRVRFSTLPVVVNGIDDQWVADLVDLPSLKRWNKGNRYLLMVIDAFSKYAWVEPAKSKTGQAVTKAFEAILKRAGGRVPRRLQTDDGKEFYNKTFKAVLKRKGIVLFSTKGDTKASIVERMNRTFKERMFRYFTAANTLVYLPVLQALMKGYNRSYHRSIGMSPQKVTPQKEPEVWDRLYKKRLRTWVRPKLRVGDQVRLNEKRRPFKKGYLPGWTEEIFVVADAQAGPVATYKLNEYDGTPLKGTFYEQDVQKVTVPDDAQFRVEKILQRKGQRVKVRWLGWPAKYDSWIPKSSLTKL